MKELQILEPYMVSGPLIITFIFPDGIHAVDIYTRFLTLVWIIDDISTLTSREPISLN